jgi:O-antigen/teichoic acid export membrane protein
VTVNGVARGTVINLSTRLLGVGLMLGITALTARIGTDTQGAFALFTSVEGVLLAVLSGFGVALARRVSHHGQEPQPLLSAIVLSCLTLGAAAGVGLWIFSRWGPPAYAPLQALALAAPALLLAPNLGGLWLGQGRMAPMAALTLAAPVLVLSALTVLAWQGPLDLWRVLTAWVLAKVTVGAWVVLYVFRKPQRARPDFRALRADLAFVATIGLSNLVSLLNYRVGLFIVERHLGLSATGIYSIAIVMAELLWFVSGSLTQASYARIGAPDRAHAAATTVRVVQLGVAGLVMAAPLLLIGAWWLVPVWLGPAYRPSVGLLAVLLPGVLLFGGASALSAYFTNHAGTPRVPALVATGSLLLNASLAWWWVPALGMRGAAWAASVAYGVSVAVLAVWFARHAGLPLRHLLLPGAQLLADLRSVASRAGGTR